MDNLKERIAYFADTETRRILGFDIEQCVKLKFPPNKVELRIKEVPYSISKSDVLPNDMTRWLASRDKSLHVQRSWEKDAYSIDNIRYTHYINYTTGKVRIWPTTTTCEEWFHPCLHSSSNSLSDP